MATKKQSVLNEEAKDMSLMEILSQGKGRDIFKKNEMSDFSYQTGIPLLDYLIGYTICIKEDGTFVSKRLNKGIPAGSFNIVTGQTMSYKSTILQQLGSNIAFKYDGNVKYYDTENKSILERIKQITRLPDIWFNDDCPRFSFNTGAIGFDTLQKDISGIYENKMKYRDVLLKDMGVVDSRNKPMKLMPPTVIIVDSLQDVISDASKYNIESKDFQNTEELRTNMAGAQNAKTMRGFITDVIPMLKEANIILICIAHTTSNMGQGPFQPPSKQFMYGSATKRISGGSSVEYNPSNALTFTGITSAESQYSKDVDGFNGNEVLVEPTKCSSNESGNKRTGRYITLVINKDTGAIDNIRSIVLFMKQRNRLKGNKAGYKVIDKSGNEITNKFTWKNIYEDFKNDTETYNTFMHEAKEEMETLAADSDENAAGTIDPLDMDNF